MDLCLVEHCQRRDPSAMLQCVPQHRVIPLLPPLLLLLPPWLLGLLGGRARLLGAADEALSPPLHFVQQVEVAAGTRHPGERRVLHDGPNLSFIQGQEAISVKKVP